MPKYRRIDDSAARQELADFPSKVLGPVQDVLHSLLANPPKPDQEEQSRICGYALKNLRHVLQTSEASLRAAKTAIEQTGFPKMNAAQFTGLQGEYIKTHGFTPERGGLGVVRTYETVLKTGRFSGTLHLPTDQKYLSIGKHGSVKFKHKPVPLLAGMTWYAKTGRHHLMWEDFSISPLDGDEVFVGAEAFLANALGAWIDPETGVHMVGARYDDGRQSIQWATDNLGRTWEYMGTVEF